MKESIHQSKPLTICAEKEKKKKKKNYACHMALRNHVYKNFESDVGRRNKGRTAT